MADELHQYLGELTVQRLRAVAKELQVDVSDCKLKKDVIDRLVSSGVTKEKAESVLSKKRHAAEKPPTEEEVRVIGSELKEIAGRPTEAKELPSDEEETIERNIDQALMMKPSFFEMDSETQRAWDRMILGDFDEALRLNREGRIRVLASFSAFQVYSTALSIRAAEALLARMAERGPVDSNMKTALAAAKKAFVDGHPKRREEALDDLENLVVKAHKAFVERTEEAEKELKALLSEYESFGVNTQEPRRLIEIAGSARRSSSIEEYSALIHQARQMADQAKNVRAAEIGRSFVMVRAALRAAGDAGVDVSKGVSDLKDAKKAFEGSAFKRALDLLATTEMAADVAHAEKIRDRNVESKQVAEVSSAIVRIEPELQEAASYGMDVQEGLLFVSKTKAALSAKDLVTAAKFAHGLREVSDPVVKDLDRKRIERGVLTKVEEAKCGKCGKESLYRYPNETRKCVECGHSFMLTAPPQVQGDFERPVGATGAAPPTAAAKPPEGGPAQQAKKQEETKKEKKGLFRW